ncbi:MAG: hypothetical protein ACKOYM_08795, partial [Actinomycetes bacterium]
MRRYASGVVAGAGVPDRVPGWGPWRSHPLPDGFEPFPDDALRTSIGERFAEVAARFPERIAVSAPSVTWTYAELAEQVRRTASGVVERVGNTAPTPVAVLA